MQNLILFLTILGILGGITIGILGRIYRPSPTALILISFPGEMLLRVLKMLILPLIISSLITGLAQLDPKSSGKMGTRALAFYVLTTFIATITGICAALIIRPGRQKITKTATVKSNAQQLTTLDALLDIIRNMFPENVVQACSQQIGTVYRTINVTKAFTNTTLLANGSNFTFTAIITEPKIIRELKYSDGSNVMGLVVFCILFGIFISHSKSEAQILYDFFFVMNELIMKIVAFIMWYSPFGIMCLVAGNIIKIENMGETAKRLSIYMITVIIGLIIHSMITVQTLYFLATRKNPFKFLKGMLQAWLTAVGTASR
jgi:solute carrier family 1 (high affinity glutamate transporter) protein 2